MPCYYAPSIKRTEIREIKTNLLRSLHEFHKFDSSISRLYRRHRYACVGTIESGSCIGQRQ